MKLRISGVLSVFLLVLAGIFFGGCSTFESRSEEKAGVFSSLSPEVKVRLKNEEVRVGDTPDMVYIAFGEPDCRTTRSDESGTAEVWTYTQSYQRYGGTGVGYAPQYTTGRNGRMIVYTVPVYTNYYDTGLYVRRQVTFRSGSAVEVVLSE